MTPTAQPSALSHLSDRSYPVPHLPQTERESILGIEPLNDKVAKGYSFFMSPANWEASRSRWNDSLETRVGSTTLYLLSFMLV